MSEWPPIAEPELLRRLSMSDREFESFLRTMVAQMQPRAFEPAMLARAVGYPWARPEGSYLLRNDSLVLLEDLDAREREDLIRRYASAGNGRLPALAIGSNGAPETLERKFAHFSEAEDRTVLALTGRLHDFDVGVAAQPTLYGSMPATLFPSAGTEVCAAVLWVTPNQFTQLAWSELTYRLGRLRARFEIDEAEMGFDEILVFVSRFGAFCVDERPVALAAIGASNRTADVLTQEELLDAAAELAIGPGAKAEALVRAIYEDFEQIGPKIAATVWKASLPFRSDRWTPFDPGVPSGG